MNHKLTHSAFMHALACGLKVQRYSIVMNDWITINDSHKWCEDSRYRIKPRTIRCGDMEFPEPLRTSPEVGSWIYISNPLNGNGYIETRWVGDLDEALMLSRGMVHATREDAESHTVALLALTEVKK